MVSEEEWAILKEHFSIDTEICVTRNRDVTTEFLLSTEPPVCDECLGKSFFFFFHIVFLFTFFLSFAAKRCREEEEELLVYRNVTVYVRRLTGSERLPEKDMSDPDYEYLNGFGKKQQYAI